ncbi:MAG: SIS domain-containing protein, partial [Candidatus Kerfeldbacteria bacterium]|nr:SIS domain-containing protein [Candidatus Kerfeldbacteria bacterium]
MGGRAIKFPSSYRSVDNIVIAGMGGSALGSDVILSVFGSTLSIPMTIVNGYQLPGWVNRRTLVLLSSYSGGTEETLAAAVEARQRGAKITGLTTGGKLSKWFGRHQLPYYRIVPDANPAGQPRMGLGYNAMGQIGLLSSIGLLKITRAEVEMAIATAARRLQACDPSVPTKRNPAKQLANVLTGRLPILIGAGPLLGSLHAFANQLNETAKVFSVAFPLPELNHHLLEGLRFPTSLRSATFVAFHSDLYWPRIMARERITLQIVAQAKLKTTTVKIQGDSRLAQALDVLALAGPTSLY